MQVLVFKDFQDWQEKNSNKHQIIEKLDLYLQKVRRMTTDDELGVRTYNAGCVMEIRLATEGGHIRLYCDTAATKMTPPILKIAGISQKSITKHGQREDILYARAIIENPAIQWVEYLSDISADMPLSMDFCQPSPEKDEPDTPRVKKEKKIKKPKKQKVITQETEPIMKNKPKKQKKTKTQVATQQPKQPDTHTAAVLPTTVPFSPDAAEQILKQINLSHSPAEELALQILRTPYREQPTDVSDDVVTDEVPNTPTDAQTALEMVKEVVTNIQKSAQPIDITDTTVPATAPDVVVSDTPVIEQQDQNTMFTEYDNTHYELEILEHKIKIQECKMAIAGYQIELQNAQIEKEILEIQRLQLLQQQQKQISH